ncbi:MAG: Mur ligase domain-containing protein, partial [Ruthenibacterium sp.]
MQSIAANTLLHGLGTLVDNPVLTGVVTDSRAVKQGSLFVCIAGERVDGHAYAKQALSQGAAGILAQHAIVGVPAQKIVMVQNVLDAMIVLGGNYRAQFTPILTGVTGSVGKTTTKEFCF